MSETNYPELSLDQASAVMSNINAELIRSAMLPEDHRHALVNSVAAGGDIILDGDPSTGKTHTAKALATTIGGVFRRIQGGPDLMTGDIIGVQIYNPATRDFEFKPGPILEADVTLADEFNRTGTKPQSAYFQAMDEGEVTVGGSTYQLRPGHLLIATRNALDVTQGTYPMTFAGTDRFATGLKMPELSKADLINAASLNYAAKRRSDIPEMMGLRGVVGNVAISPEAYERAADIIVNLRLLTNIVDVESSVLSGARPMKTMLRAAQANAVRNNRAAVELGDLHHVAPYTLGHRVAVTEQQGRKNVTSMAPISMVLNRLPLKKAA